MEPFKYEKFDANTITYRDRKGTQWKREDDDFCHKFYILKDGELGDEAYHYDGSLPKKIDSFYKKYGKKGSVKLIHDEYIERCCEE